jgi:hypothetical protein
VAKISPLDDAGRRVSSLVVREARERRRVASVFVREKYLPFVYETLTESVFQIHYGIESSI